MYFEEKFRNGNERKIDQTPHKIPPHPPAHINAANTVQRKILRRCLRVQVRFHSSSWERAIGIGITRSHLPGKRGEMRRFSSVPLILSFVVVGAREMIWKFQTRRKSLCCVLIIIAARERRQNGKRRGRSSNSSSPSSSASSSLGCRGGWENIAFFLTFPSNHRSLSLWNSYTQTRGFTAGYRQVLAEEQIVERGAFCRASFCRFFSFFFPDRRPLRGGGGGWMMFSFLLFFSLVFWKYASKATTTREEE